MDARDAIRAAGLPRILAADAGLDERDLEPGFFSKRRARGTMVRERLRATEKERLRTAEKERR